MKVSENSRLLGRETNPQPP